MKSKIRVVKWVPTLLATLLGVVMLSATAMAADGDVTSITLYDASGNNGKIDRADVVVEYANANACTGIAHATNVATTIGQWTATDAGTGNPVDIVPNTGISWVSGSAGVSCTFRLTLDDQDVHSSVDTSATALDVTYNATGNELAITNGANPANVTTVLSGDITETDAANPILVSATLATASNKNTIAYLYSEAMYIDSTNQDGNIDGADTTSDEEMTSTATIGNIDAAGSIEQFGNFGTAGTVTQNAATNNNIAVSTILADGARTITITLNSVTGTFFTNSTTTPSGAVTPDGTNYVLAQAPAATLATQAVNTSGTPTAGGAGWHLTAPTTAVTGLTPVSIGGAGTSVTLNWAQYATLADFGQYIFVYGTTAGVGLSDTAWTAGDDADIDLIATTDTIITGLTNGNNYFTKVYAVDIAGNVSAASSEISYYVAGGASTSGDTAPGVPTGLSATTNANGEIELTWTDPSDTDLEKVEINRSKGDNTDTLSVFNSVSKGVGAFTDSDVVVGEIVNYQLRAYDTNGNTSSMSELLTITVGAEAETQITPAEVTTTDETTNNTTTETEVTTTVTLTYEEEQQQVKDLGVLTKEFDKATNKCEALVMISRSAGWEVDETVTEDGFDDTPSWCKPYAAKAKALGVVEGRTATELGVAGEVNRYEIAMMLARVLGATEADMEAAADLNLYDDEIVVWAKGAVNWLHSEGVMTGYPDGTFGGANGVLKIELAVALGRAFELFVSAEAAVNLTATLTGAAEVPAVETEATGSCEVTLEGTTATYTCTVEGLTVDAAHFHMAVEGENGDVVHTIVFDGLEAAGTWSDLTEAQVTALSEGGVYVNVHTEANASGEIRGQVL